MKNLSFLIATIILMELSQVNAQDETHTNFYVNFGLGVSSLNLGINVNANLRIDDIVATGRATGAATGVLGSGLEEYAFLVGYIKRIDDFHFTLSGGLGEAEYHESKGLLAKSQTSKSLGLAFEGQLCYPFLNFLGIGVTLYGNVNGSKSFVGLTVNLFLGGLNL